MTSKVIRISGELFQKLQSYASAHGLEFSSPENVIRLMLDMEQLPGPRHKPDK